MNSDLKSLSESELERIIPPEIKDDEFYQLIETLARTEKLRHVLEIGSSAGGGSTEAFVKGLRDNPNKPLLFCIEISRPRFKQLADTYKPYDFVHCYNLSSVSVDEFPSPDMVAAFYETENSGLKHYPLPQVLGWLQQDIQYVREAGVGSDAVERIKADHDIACFDMVLIDGSEFTGSVELEKVYGASIILLDDTNTYKCWEVRRRLLADPAYELIADNQELRNGFSAFRRRPLAESALPIHFFTIVLNGEPFIRYHERVFSQLPLDWHWHVVEGVAALKHDTAWSVAAGGKVVDSVHDRGRSNDGTSAYLDELAARFPDRVTIHRKPLGEFWDGKREMVNAPLPHITKPGLLWQVDADELWTLDQIRAVHARFEAEPERTAAFYWCDYFVGPDRLIATRHNYAQNPNQEWLRTWRFEPGMTWAAHEPPVLADRRGTDMARVNPFTHDEMEDAGVVFQHFAYVTEAQAAFKETYYGYRDARAHWRRLQEATGPVLLKDYLPWVTDETLVDTADARGVVPIAAPSKDGRTDAWRFRYPAEAAKGRHALVAAAAHPRVVVDGVFYQHLNSGIARVWTAVLTAWVESGFARHVLLLDRAGTAPRIPGVHTRTIRAHSYETTGADSLYLERICREEGADLFVSTYYSTPTTTPSLFMGYDMVPEALGFPLDDEAWREKHRAIQHAAAHVMISHNSARDLERLFPSVTPGSTAVAHCGVDVGFRPAEEAEVAAFRQAHGIDRPYLLMVGERSGYQGYKNGSLLFRALGRMAGAADEVMVVCVGGHPEIEADAATLAPGVPMVRLELSDDELRLAYAGARALVYPSRYEGFGMPIVEAMACGCPVITCANSSIIEVAGEAALFVGETDADGMAERLREVVDPQRRADLIRRGLEQAGRFTFAAMAETMARALTETGDRLKTGALRPPGPVWRELKTMLVDVQKAQAQIRAAALEPAAPDPRQLLAECEQELARVKEMAASIQNSPFWRVRNLMVAGLRKAGLRHRT